MQIESVAGFRLSPQQERIFAAAGDAGYPTSACLYECTGRIQTQALRDALATIVARHEILRTVFRKQRELKLPLQVILDEDVPDLQFEDFTHLSPPEQRRELRCRFALAAQKISKAGDAPVVTCTLFRLADNNHALLIALPGMCADAASFQVLAEELRQALSTETPIGEWLQYADVTEWQHDLLGATEDAANLAKTFWQNQAHTPLLLPLEAEPLEAESACAETVNFRLSAEIVLTLRAVAQARGMTEADVLLAAWHLLLGRMTGEPRTVVLMASAGREYDEIKNAIGLFARFLPIAVDLEGKSRFEEILRNVATLSRQARDQQDWFKPGSAAATPAIGFEYRDLRHPPVGDATQLAIVPVALHVALEKLKLSMIATDSNDGLSVDLEYDPLRYTLESIEQLASSLEVLLTQVLAAPLLPLQNLSLLSAAATGNLLSLGMGPLFPPPSFMVPLLFRAQSLRTPLSAAVRSGAEVLSYADLESLSNRLGHYLARQGVQRGSLVGLCVSRSAEMMVPVLAILKAGGAYVPLGADQPKARTLQQLGGIDVLVTEAQYVDQLPEFPGQTVLLDGNQWKQEPDTGLDVEVTGDDLAYVIYTSGSTGTPKGVGVRHGNLVNYATHMVRALALDQQPLQYATVSTLAADLGNTVIYPSLLTGGCLHVLDYEVATDSQQMAQYQSQYGIDVLKIVPSHLQALMEGSGTAVLPNRYLITGGEALKPALLERIVAAGRCEVINHYGPTETTVGSLMLRLRDYDWKRSGRIPIGRPISNTRVYVLDANRMLLPAGVAGELYIAGAGVTSGYVGQPEMTADRFVPDLSVSGERMYRTGDLVRWLPEGVIEFLGRADDQVKIRGYRVELGEIETVLASEAGVRQCVVIARSRPENPDDQQIVAYVVLDRQQATATSDNLRQSLKQRLPDYMVPSAIVVLPRLPLTPNGKVDRKALPAPEDRAAKEYKAPATLTEELVAQIWADVLKLDRISTDENFFDLGGHSLLATQVISRIRRVLEVDLPLRTMFDTPTVGRIAGHIDAARLPGAVDSVPVMTPARRGGPLPLSYAQQRLWILDQLEPNNSMYNVPRTLRMQGQLDSDALSRSLNEIIRRHEPLRTWFATENGQPVQHIEAALELHVKHLDLTRHPAPQREAIAHEIAAAEATTPFDLSVAPLLRAVLLKLDAYDHVLMLTMHHIVSDAWSATIFMQELRALYEGFLAGTQPDLPELTLQYADYASWQRSWLQGDTLDRQLAFWRDQLAGAPPLLTLPTDRPRPEKQSFAGNLERFTLPPEVCVPLKALCRKEGVTLFMALLAAYHTLLSRLSGQEQVVVGTDSANRFTVETERMIGFFINLLALKIDFAGDPTFRELLRRARETTLACYAHQEMPFDKIVEELRPDRTLSHNPIVQVLFVMQNTPTTSKQFGGLEIGSFNVPLTRSKFDIAVFAIERADSVECIWVYSIELFEASTIRNTAQMFATLLAHAVANPETRVSALELYSEEQKTKLREEKLQRRQSSKNKLMSAGPKAFDPRSTANGSGAGE